jgi:HEPN domain-containing protein
MNEKIESIKKWIEKGDHDLGTAMITYQYLPKYKDTIAFHCQQAVEKYLKSFLFYLGLPIKRTHDLIFLLEQINMNETVEQVWFEKALELQDFAVEIRYPDMVIELSNTEIETAIEISKDFRKFILVKLKIDIDFDYLD